MVCLGKVLPCQWWLKCDLWRNRIGDEISTATKCQYPQPSTADQVTHVHRSCCNDSGTGRLSGQFIGWRNCKNWMKTTTFQCSVTALKSIRYLGSSLNTATVDLFEGLPSLKTKMFYRFWQPLLKIPVYINNPHHLTFDHRFGWSLSTWPWHHSLPFGKPSVIPRQSHHSRHSGGHEAPNDRSLKACKRQKKNSPTAGNLMIMHIFL